MSNHLSKAKEVFSVFLKEHGYRKTPERIAILEEIYHRDDHFDAETLYLQLSEKNHRASRATVYNTLDLLVSCSLAIKHQFGKSQTLYEKAYGKRQHDHIICMHCNKVEEFCDPRLQPIKTMMGELFDYRIVGHSLNLYGVCSQCRAQETIQSKRSLNTQNNYN